MKTPQGKSARVTELKQRGLGWAYQIGFAVINKNMWQWPNARYFNFDLNAGSGFNDEFGCVGSPLTFRNEALLAGCNRYFSGLVDWDRNQVATLRGRPEIANDPHCEVFHCNNREFIPTVPDFVRRHGDRPHYAIGSVLSDPNGADVPIEALGELAEICPKIDCIFHWNSTITKRLKYGIKPEQITLEHVPRLVRKDHWLIREPLGIHQFTILIGRNHRFGDWKAQGFFHLDSERGEEILEICSRSERERTVRRSPSLPGLFNDDMA